MGADYLGLIFTHSARKITTAQAGEIRLAVPDAALVGVFAEMGLDEVALIASTTGLDMIQLHGNESPDYVEAIGKSTGLPLMRALTHGRGSSITELSRFPAADYLLFDLPKGKKNSMNALLRLWDKARRATEAGGRLFLAGCLGADNVRAAIAHCRPFGVDVCSGVETKPGKKDLNAVKRFISEVKACRKTVQ